MATSPGFRPREVVVPIIPTCEVPRRQERKAPPTACARPLSMNGKHGWCDAPEMVAMWDRLKNRNPASDVHTQLSARPQFTRAHAH